MTANPFQKNLWQEIENDFTDITFHRALNEKAVRIAFNRPDCRNAFRPQTVDELAKAFSATHEMSDIGTVILTGNGPCPNDGGWAFSSGGDQKVRGKDGYLYQDEKKKLGRLHILEVQRLIRFHA